MGLWNKSQDWLVYEGGALKTGWWFILKYCPVIIIIYTQLSEYFDENFIWGTFELQNWYKRVYWLFFFLQVNEKTLVMEIFSAMRLRETKGLFMMITAWIGFNFMMIKKDSDYDYSMKSIPPLTKLDIVLKSMISETSFISRLFRLQRKRYPKWNAIDEKRLADKL